MRTISSIRTAALVVVLLVAPAATGCSQRVEPRPPPSQDQTTMKAFGPDAARLVIDRFATVRDSKQVLDAARAGADLEGIPS